MILKCSAFVSAGGVELGLAPYVCLKLFCGVLAEIFGIGGEG
jgi:hypothetical protein